MAREPSDKELVSATWVPDDVLHYVSWEKLRPATHGFAPSFWRSIDRLRRAVRGRFRRSAPPPDFMVATMPAQRTSEGPAPPPLCEFTKAAATDFQRCPAHIQRGLASKIDRLYQVSGTPTRRHSRRLVGARGLQRIRQGAYRLVYTHSMGQILVVAVGHRRDVYRHLGL
jgi:mRNA-degrading endonuclease RelE of RelBE toxin-antitoxin system